MYVDSTPPVVVAQAASASQRRPERRADSSERIDTAWWSGPSCGTWRAMSPIAAAPSTARAQNGPRQPVSCPVKAPSGTPTTLASMAPEPTTPRARELAAGPATRAATTLATAQNAPVASAVRNRAASSSAKLEPSATMTCPTAKTPRASTSVSRLGSRSVSIAINGAPTIIPTAKTVISNPARATLTRRSPAISGSSPATTNSVVPIRNVPSASTYTTGGSRVGERSRSSTRMSPGASKAPARVLIFHLQKGAVIGLSTPRNRLRRARRRSRLWGV